jgi:trk system potassium uptake protein TrkH
MGALAVVALIGRMVVLFALLLLVPLAFALADHDPAEGAFLTAAGVTLVCGLAMSLATRRFSRELQPRDGFLLVGLTWATLPLFGALPLWLAIPGLITPRIADTARAIWVVYGSMAVGCFLAYRAAGMSWADAFMHMCTTVSLGGFSSHDASFGHWNSPAIEAVAIVFMLLSGVNLVLYFVAWRGRSLAPLPRNAEIQVYVGVLAGTIALITAYLWAGEAYPTLLESLRHAAFHVVSIATTTGYAADDYAQWPLFAPLLMILLGCFATCAGSTGGGIKMVRMLLLKQSRRELIRIVHPNAVTPVVLGGVAVGERVLHSVIAYMMMYGASLVTLTMVLLFSGLDVVTAFTTVIACVNNIGPGLGEVGPAVNYGKLSDFQTWVCSFAMLLGRLELLAVLVLFTPSFWRK